MPTGGLAGAGRGASLAEQPWLRAASVRRASWQKCFGGMLGFPEEKGCGAPTACENEVMP